MTFSEFHQSFIVCYLSWLVNGGIMQHLPLLVTQVLYAPHFPVTSDDDVTEHSYVGIC
jgi:hypothetical protein